MAKLFFKYGAMNSGKTTILLQTAFNYEERGMNVLIIKPGIDTKGETSIVSRIGLKKKVDIIIDENSNVYDIILEEKQYKDIACILVDEAQFIEEEQAYDLFKIATKLDIPVICFGLRSDFKMKVFKASAILLAISHELVELKTICRCSKKAMFNGRKINNKFVFDGDSVAIDGEGDVTYESLCGKCYLKLKEEYDNNLNKIQ